MRFPFHRFFYILTSLLVLAALLYYGRTLFVPVAFALLFSFILFPLLKWFEKRRITHLFAVIFTILTPTIILAGVIYLFSTQLSSLASEFGNFVDRMNEFFTHIAGTLNEYFQIYPGSQPEEVKNRFTRFFSSSGVTVVSDTIRLTTKFFAWLSLTFLTTFLILFYHRRLTYGFTLFANEENRPEFLNMMKRIRLIGQHYLSGMIILIILLGILYSAGLWIVGIDYAFFFGFLASLLAVIPYIGTTTGGLIPTLYALVTYEGYWYPAAVIAVFVIGQFIESNFLNPVILGSNLHINALAAVLTLILGGLLWGIPGMILFLPLTAIAKEIFLYYENLQPLHHLISDDEIKSKKYKTTGGLISRIKKLLKFGSKSGQ